MSQDILNEFTNTPTLTNEIIESLKLRRGEVLELRLTSITKEIIDYNKKNSTVKDESKVQEEFVLHLEQIDNPEVKYKFSRRLRSPVLEKLKEQLKSRTLPQVLTFMRDSDSMGSYQVFIQEKKAYDRL